MSLSPARNLTRLAAAIVVAAVIIGAAFIASSYLGTATTQTATKTEIETTTTTLTPGAEIEPNGSLLLSKTMGPWVYDVSVNSTSVSVGGALLAFGDLTYRGQSNVTIDEVEPLNGGLAVFNSTGGLVWEYTPSEINFDATITPGESLGGSICIPITVTSAPSVQSSTCSLSFLTQAWVPGVYSMEVAPGFYSVPSHQDLGDNLQITANFTIF